MSKACPTKEAKNNNPKSPTRTTSTTRQDSGAAAPSLAALAPESVHPTTEHTYGTDAPIAGRDFGVIAFCLNCWS